MKKVYLDNAATSYPKPREVIIAMERYMQEIGVSPGRGNYGLSLDAGRILYDTRSKLKDMFHCPSEENIIFTHNITHALNYAIMGILRPGDHVITTSMEHNSVIRPLRYLEKSIGIELKTIECDPKGSVEAHKIRENLKPNTRLIVFTHASNVTGNVLPLDKMCSLKHDTEALLMLDAAQTAGIIDIDFEKLNLDFLCFTGHKSLYGPPGTGGMVLSKRAVSKIRPLIHGGTGSRSHLEVQPEFMPDKLEPGTPNTVGISGLNAGLNFIMERGIKKIKDHELELTRRLLQGLKDIPEVKIYGPDNVNERVSTVSITIEDRDLAEVAYRLDYEYGIMVRTGLHCAPLAHKTIGTFPQGTLRFSLGYFNTLEEILYTLEALKAIIAD